MNGAGRVLVATLVLLLAALVAGTKGPERSGVAGLKHFIFFDRERQRITEPTFLENRFIAGAQLKYTWRELEPERDRYELRPLLDDLAFLKKHGKRLFVQLQDVSFPTKYSFPTTSG